MLVSAGGRVTTAAPQLGFFNQGSPENHPAAKGKLRWRSLETYIERNAFKMRLRVSVFAGPVFNDEKDPEYRFGVKVANEVLEDRRLEGWNPTGIASSQGMSNHLSPENR